MHRDLPAARGQRQRDLAAQPFGGAGHENNGWGGSWGHRVGKVKKGQA